MRLHDGGFKMSLKFKWSSSVFILKTCDWVNWLPALYHIHMLLLLSLAQFHKVTVVNGWNVEHWGTTSNTWHAMTFDPRQQENSRNQTTRCFILLCLHLTSNELSCARLPWEQPLIWLTHTIEWKWKMKRLQLSLWFVLKHLDLRCQLRRCWTVRLKVMNLAATTVVQTDSLRFEVLRRCLALTDNNGEP